MYWPRAADVTVGVLIDDDDEREIEDLTRRWAEAVHSGDLGTVLPDPADDLVMFDVPPPDDGVRGIDAYGETWTPFFEWQRSETSFEIVALDVPASDDVGFAWALLHCGTPHELERDPATACG